MKTLIPGLAAVFVTVGLAGAGQIEVTLADFEGGVDPRGSIGWNAAGLLTGGPWYAWEQPPSPAGDDMNYWDVYSDRNNIDEPVDYELNFPA